MVEQSRPVHRTTVLRGISHGAVLNRYSLLWSIVPRRRVPSSSEGRSSVLREQCGCSWVGLRGIALYAIFTGAAPTPAPTSVGDTNPPTHAPTFAPTRAPNFADPTGESDAIDTSPLPLSTLAPVAPVRCRRSQVRAMRVPCRTHWACVLRTGTQGYSRAWQLVVTGTRGYATAQAGGSQ